MKQPDLGKKILELRLAKGLTQKELAEKSNIGLRTIQRIESAEVTPRSYTIKLIFKNLDYEIYNSSGKRSYWSTKLINRIKTWLEQFYTYVLDLFNLKTNKMKKISILLIMLSSLISSLFLFCFDGNAQTEDSPTLVKARNEIKVGGTFNGWDKPDIFAARDVKCSINEVYFNVALISLDKRSHVFYSFVKGKLHQNKVEVSTNHEDIECVSYEADDIIKSENRIVLKGNAKLISICGSFKDSMIEANEIVIMLE